MKGKTILVPTPPLPHSSYPLSAPRNMTFNTFVHPLEYPPLTPTSRRRGGGGGCVLRAKPASAFAIFSLSRIHAAVKEFAHTILFCTLSLSLPKSVGEAALPPPQIFRNLFCHYPVPTHPWFWGRCRVSKEERAWVVSSLRCR